MRIKSKLGAAIALAAGLCLGVSVAVPASAVSVTCGAGPSGQRYVMIWSNIGTTSAGFGGIQHRFERSGFTTQGFTHNYTASQPGNHAQSNNSWWPNANTGYALNGSAMINSFTSGCSV